MLQDKFLVYGGTNNHRFDAEVIQLVNNATGLRLGFSHVWHHMWADGEPGFRPQNPDLIAGKHVIVFSCPITTKLEIELRDLVCAAKHQYGAASVTVVMPFLRYRRQDHAEIRHEITRLRWFLSDLKHWGADRLIVCDPHSVEHTKRFCEEFGLRLFISDPTEVFADAVRKTVQVIGTDCAMVYSPDMGSVGRAIAFANELGLGVIATPKKRQNGDILRVENEHFLAEVAEKYGADVSLLYCDFAKVAGLTIIMREDEIDTASTAAQTAEALRAAGAKNIWIVATHPVCSPLWKLKLFPYGARPPFDKIWIGNTRPRGQETEYEGSTGGKVTKVDMAPVVARTLGEVLEGIVD